MIDKTNQEPGMTGQYTGRGGVQPIDFIISNHLSFLEGCIVKYLYRYPFKNGLEDLRKARTYLDWLIQSLESKMSRIANPYIDRHFAFPNPNEAVWECKCPRCGRRHNVCFYWVGRGKPRIYCDYCRLLVAELGEEPEPHGYGH